MKYPDYKVQVLREPRQWASGLLCKLSLDDSGIGLFASPSFERWLAVGETEDWTRVPCSRAIAADECGQILWIDCPGESTKASGHPYCRLRLYNPENGTTETLLELDRLLSAARKPIEPDRLWIGESGVWLYDRANARLLGFASDSLQLFRVIDVQGRVRDLAFDGEDTFYVLVHDSGEFWIARYDGRFERGGALCRWRCRDRSSGASWEEPFALAVSTRWLWVLDRGPRDPQGVRSPQLARLALQSEPGAEPDTDECGEPRDVCDEDPRCEIIPIPRKRPSPCKTSLDDGLDADLIPRQIAVDCQDNLLILFEDRLVRPRLMQFDPAGSLLGEIRLPTKPAPPGHEKTRVDVGRICAIVPGIRNEIFLATDLGLAWFTLENVPIGESGVYYLRTLDNGLEDGTWHRLAVRAHLPPSTRLEVQAFVSNQGALKESIDAIIDDQTLLPQEKKREIERRLGPSWKPVAQFRGPSEDPALEGPRGGREVPVARGDSPGNLNHDALFVENRGRYLWLRLSLASFNERARPTIGEVQVFHPRKSYLRYLPATFQEVPGDPSSETVDRDFLERFLSLFESVLWALDVEIDRLFEYFDPDTTPPDFLPWLACWLNIALEEDWPEDRKRVLIGSAWELYQMKGTVAGLARLIRIVTGVPARIIEESRIMRPVPLGEARDGGWRLGCNTFVRRGPARGVRVGDSSLLGHVALRSKVPDPTDPFAVSAHRFTVLVFGDPDAARAAEPLIRRLVDEHKPAHTLYTLRLVAHGRMGHGLRIGLNTRMVGGSPLRLGENTALGRAITISRTPRRTRLGSASRLGRGFKLT